MSNSKQTLFLIILIGSLAVNFFLMGIVAGNYLARGQMHHGPPPPPSEGWPTLIRALVQYEKTAPLMQQQKTVLSAQRQQLQQSQRAIFDQLTAEPLNSQALLAALKKFQQEHSQLQQMISQLLVDAANQLSLQERQELVEFARRRPPPPPRFHRPPFEEDHPPPPPNRE